MNTTLLIIIFVVYAIIMLTIAFTAMKKTTHTIDGYFLADRSIGLLIGMFTLSASMFSSFTFLGLPGEFYNSGAAYYGMLGNLCVQACVFYIVGSRMWGLGKRYGFISLSDLVANRYESRLVCLLVVIFSIIGTIPTIGMQLRGGAILLNSITGDAVPFNLALAYVTIFVTFYVFVGGMRAVVWTDTVQGIIMVTMIIVAVPIVVKYAGGGIDNLFTSLAAQKSEYLSAPGATGNWGYVGVFSAIFIMTLNICCPYMYQRAYACKSLLTLKKLSVAGPVLSLIITLPMMYIGLAGQLWRPGIASSDQILPVMIAELLPTAFGAILLLAIICAIMSTADSMILSTTSLFMKDIYLRFLKKDASDQHIFFVSRIMIIVVVLSAVLIALFGPISLIGMMLGLSFPILVQTGPLMLGGLFWRRSTKAGAISSLLVGETLVFTNLAGLWQAPFGVAAGIWAFLAAFVVFVVVCLLTQPASQTTIDRFFPEKEMKIKGAAVITD